jgi:hypothetical protein
MDRNKMTVTPEEQKALDWCYQVLSEEQIAECHDEAEEIAGSEVNAEEAADLLVRTATEIIVRNAQAERARATTSVATPNGLSISKK